MRRKELGIDRGRKTLARHDGRRCETKRESKYHHGRGMKCEGRREGKGEVGERRSA